MQASPPEYTDLIGEIGLFLGSRAQKLRAAWGPRRIVLDPGFGFGKTADQNFQLLRRLSSLRSSSYPLLIGLSRKNMIGQATGRSVDDRLPAALPPPWPAWRVARPSCGCTMWPPRSTR